MDAVATVKSPHIAEAAVAAQEAQDPAVAEASGVEEAIAVVEVEAKTAARETAAAAVQPSPEEGQVTG